MILEEIIRKQKQQIERLEKENIKLQLSYQECWEDRLKLNEKLEELKNKYMYVPKTNFSEVIKLRDEKKKLQERIDKVIEYIWSTKYEWGDLEEDNEDFDIDIYKLLDILKGEK